MTLGDRILEAIRYRPLDDDQLAKLLEVSQRQTINITARKLESQGLLRRYVGADGKLVNELTGKLPQPDPAATVNAPVTPSPGPADSAAQRNAEGPMLKALGDKLGVELKPRRLEHHTGVRVEIDGADDDLTTLAECWAHQGPAKVAQKMKLVNDAMKLQWVASWLTPTPRRLILCVSDEAAVRHLRGKSWQAMAISDAGVELQVVELDAAIVASIVDAQTKQYR